MHSLIVVDELKDWPLEETGAQLVRARDYLADASFATVPRARVFNLCRSYRYQSTGYYVSLLADARGHRPLPSVSTIQDLKLPSIWRGVSGDLDELIQKSMQHLQSGSFTLSIYFGRNLAQHYDRLAQHLFNLYQAPFLQALFLRDEKDGHWFLQRLRPLSASDVPEGHRDFAGERARSYFSGRSRAGSPPRGYRYSVALLVNPDEPEPPSNPRALQRFERAARRLRLELERITKDDFGRLAEFDALFIRETTHVNHHTYRFARKAAAEGLVVMDDPESILRCTNKVFLAELLRRNRVPTPNSLIVHRGNRGEVMTEIGLPCILKQPDSAFSLGVTKVDTPEELEAGLKALLSRSDLVLAQEFLPTPFDWRIGVLDGQPLFACRYHMAPKHWQILRHDANGITGYGQVDTLPVEQAPLAVVQTALKAAGLIGKGLYGVDLKQIGNRVYVIEVNDNPNIDAGLEDAVLKDELYHRVMQTLLYRIERRRIGFLQ